MTRGVTGLITTTAILTAVIALHAQGPRGRGAANARTAAPVDLTGYWVSVVSEDWRFRMATPRRGDYESVPISGEGRRIADAWDLARDDAAGLQCKAFGAGGIMRQPGRLHIAWQDDSTLKLEFDAGSQTRLLRFGRGGAPGEKTWQGYSLAEWESPPPVRGGNARAQIGNSTGPIAPGGGGRGQRGGPTPSGSISQGGDLKVVTTGFREGYLRKNGVSYSENATITEYFHRLPAEPGEDTWLLVITVVEDPRYLTQPFYTSTQFKLEPDGSKWAPKPCHTDPPPPPASSSR
ncbi:MAG TPA: hypothetical protein VFY29_01395 [Terriglobia bacterium]|nr:hypothetical protein [Terriglobia bacterium]